MKRILIILLFISVSVCNAQNLIPNPRFEDIFCPTGDNEMNACADWKNFGNSPDYYNACADSGGMNVPYSEAGFQLGHAGGKAYAGLITYYTPLEFPNYREFIGVQLLQPLQIGQRYYVTFYVSFWHIYDNIESIGANKMGCKFSTVAFDSCCPPPLDNFADIYSDSIITDTLNWTLIRGSMIADSNYSYFIIGNFFDDSHTDTLNLGEYSKQAGSAYYYISDVAVSTDSIYTETWTGLPEEYSNQSQILIYPNPTNGEINIKANSPIESIQILNTLSQIVYSSENLNSIQYKLSLANTRSGLYYVKIKTKTNLSYSTINLTH